MGEQIMHLYMTTISDQLRGWADWALREKDNVQGFANIDEAYQRNTYAGYLQALDDIELKFNQSAYEIDNLFQRMDSTLDEAKEILEKLNNYFKGEKEYYWKQSSDMAHGRADMLNKGVMFSQEIIRKLEDWMAGKRSF